MAYPQTGRVPVEDKYWIRGCNTLAFPTDLPQGSYYWGENISCRGGVVQTRPGRRMLFRLPGRRAQGLCIYRPFREKEQLVWAIDGNIFWSQYPFTTYAQVPNVQFWQDSPQVYFCQARTLVNINPDGSLTLLATPVDMLMMQDGYTASAFYVATSSSVPEQAGHNKGGPPYYQCPVGTVMAYSGNRLWTAYQQNIYASDLGNPNSFTERLYLAEADGFALPEPCTGLLETVGDPSSNVAPGLLAFSPFSITSFQSSVLDRSQWQLTPNFQTIISRDYGSIAPFGNVNQFGLPWFPSEVGLMRMDQAFNQYRSSRVDPSDMEMLRSKDNLSPDRSGMCAVSFENWLLLAVPSGSRWNRHTWVMDGSPQALLNGQAPPAWVGIWTGSFPVQFATGEIQDVPRCFELGYSCNPTYDSAGNDYHIYIWEDFMGRRTDQPPGLDVPIHCSWETKIFEVSQVGELIRFKYAELDLIEIVGEVSLQIFYAPIKGHYRQIHQLLLSAEEGPAGSPDFPLWTYQGLGTDTVFQTFRPQTRTIRTPDVTGAPSENDGCSDTCEIESPYQHSVDKGFQILVNWQGRLGIRELRVFVEPYAQPGIGACTPTEVGELNIVSAIGCLPPPSVCTVRVP